MRSEFIKEEAKKGNSEARKNAPKIDMLPPISQEEALSKLDRRDRDRSRSKSKSPAPEGRGLGASPSIAGFSDRNKSRIDLHQAEAET